MAAGKASAHHVIQARGPQLSKLSLIRFFGENGQLSALCMGKDVAVIIISSLTHGDIMMWSTMSNISGEKVLDTANMQIFTCT